MGIKGNQKVWSHTAKSHEGYQIDVASYKKRKNKIYLTGYFYDDIYKIDPKGKILWKASVKEFGVGDAYGTSYKKGVVTVYYESSPFGGDLDMDKNYYVRFNASNGEIVDDYY